MVHAGVTESQWPPYMREIYRILKPGNGWAEMIELGFPFAISDNKSLPEDAPLSKVIAMTANGNLCRYSNI